MTSLLPRLHHRLTRGILALVFVTMAQAQATWDLMQHDGRDYVSLNSLKAFYNFPR